MAPHTLDFKCAIITGAAGGLGRAMAEWLVTQGKKVILVGRTEKTLKETAKSLGDAAYYVLDVGKIEAVDDFVKWVTTNHPAVDCLINNAGVQQPLYFDNYDLATADQEININIRGPMHLVVGLLPHFKAKSGGAVIMNVSSVLGFIPFEVINPGYCASKAWIHLWTMTLRTQLQKHNIKVVEIVPPAVGTDLHRHREDPDDNKPDKNPIALSVEQFMEELVQGWKGDDDVVSAGPGVQITKKYQDTYGARYEEGAKKYLEAESEKSGRAT